MKHEGGIDLMAGDNAQAERQLVVFDLSAEAYGVDIGAVREIIRMQEITAVPQTPDFVEGVINLRGKVTPVVDLRKKLGVAVGEKSDENRIVVMDIGGQDIGMVVDAVNEVLRISADSVEPPSSVVSTAEADYIMGIAKLDSKLIILLNLSRVLSVQEQEALSETAVAA
jgi:purine-binding chemotaxis protein CheW